ncbi:hypothetical protein GCM10028807_12000 [Spirosoma daeguense]
MASSPFNILLVDDDSTLGDLMNRAAATSFPEARFIQVTSFEEAKQHLEALDDKKLNLLLLDIDLQQQVDGLDFLALVRSHPQGRLLPVVILSGTYTQAQIDRAYFIGASSFTIKPYNLTEWKTYLTNLRAYWYSTVTLPSRRY